ncbi:putative oligosaccaryltransferase, oligosaccharyltransferase subunit ost4p superfamily [Helianthus annuus]|nr:putative oligosaccaryltransferase, oligosaccharyltransferase subunit ost4p superfamily [Helianthus annuus]KAJ0762855.1 putative oligosaccaryltransferase, oligosaccharyltransferase subunit ost4p superfamily [Helianthus annuus]
MSAFTMGSFMLDLMFNDQDLGFFANSLGIIILFLVIGYHFVMADTKYEGN